MGQQPASRQTVKCDKCGQNIRIKMRRKRKGDLEYQFFTCKRCNTAYVVAVTDPALRREVQRYEDLMNQARALSEQAQQLLQDNVKRSRELMDQYPLENYRG